MITTSNIDRFVTSERDNDILFEKFTAVFSSKDSNNLNKLGLILESDGILFKVHRKGLWTCKLTTEIPVVAKFNQDEYEKVIGKFFILASRCYVSLDVIGLIG